VAAWEIASVAGSILIAEWILSVAVGRSKVMVAIPIGLMFALVTTSHYVRSESLRELGFRFDNFLRACKLLLAPMLVVSLICVAIGWFVVGKVDFFRWHSTRPIAGQLALGLGWGFVQQYVLQSLINRRAQIIFGTGWISVFLVALIFGGLHLPNPWLAVLTTVGGLVWGAVFQKAPNLPALALSHVLMTWMLVSTLPVSTLNHLRIGFKYFG
jgi:hypothetical protein